MANESFEKPSDYSEGGGGGGDSTSIWIWIGGGCALFALIGAVILAFGLYKGFSCCQQALETQAQVRMFAVDYARTLRDGDYGTAWGRTTESFRSRTSRDSFEKRLGQYRDLLRNSVPEPRGINRHLGRDDTDYWEVDVGFMPEQGKTFLVMSVRAVEEGDGEDAVFRVDALQFQRVRREISSERPVRLVQAFNRHVAEDRLERARKLLAEEFSEASSKEAFESFVQKHDAIVGRTIARVGAVRYDARGKSTVDVLQDRRGGGRSRVRYHLVKKTAIWRIAQIEFGVGREGRSAPPPREATEDATDDATSEADGPNLDAE